MTIGQSMAMTTEAEARVDMTHRGQTWRGEVIRTNLYTASIGQPGTGKVICPVPPLA